MRNTLFALFVIVLSSDIYGQKVDSVEVPKGVVYNYCDPLLVRRAELTVRKDLSSNSNYALIDNILWIGPVLWSRYKEVKTLSVIEGGNTTLLVDNKKLSAKLIQNVTDSKKIWNQLREEVNTSSYSIRKASYKELQYYWSVISFDVDEPLLIIDGAKHRYILNISPKTMKLLWLDEVPLN
jgi:hypothetical protein